MARLFISLYLFIVLAMIGLSAGLERAFSPEPQGPTGHVKTIMTLFDTAINTHSDPLQLAKKHSTSLSDRTIRQYRLE